MWSERTDRRAASAAILALAFFLLAGPRPVAGQEVSVGAEMGVSFFTFGGEGLEGLDEYRTGLVGGVSAAYRLTDLWSLESGVRWVEKGAEGDLVGFEGPISADQRLSYVQVPLLLRVAFLPESPVRPSLSAGPAISFETRCRMRALEPASVVSCDAEEDRPGTDVGFLFGAGVSWRVGPADVLVEGRYDLGLRDIDTVDALDTHNRGFTLAPRISIPVRR